MRRADGRRDDAHKRLLRIESECPLTWAKSDARYFCHCQFAVASFKTAGMRLSQVLLVIVSLSLLASCAAKPEPKKRETVPKSLKWTSTIDRW
jgi:hypothetical protein